MNTKIFGFSLSALLLSVTSQADTFDVDLNNETLKAQYNLGDRSTDLNISGSAMLTDDKGQVFAFTVRTQGRLNGQQGIYGGFGGRLYHASPEGSDSFQSLAVGGYLDYTLPQLTSLTLGLEIYYGPDITTSDDIDNMREMNFRASYQLFENAAAYAGLRYIEFESGNSDYEFDDGLNIGFTLQF